MPRKGHSTVSVYMMAWDAPRVIEFIREVFGGEVILRYDRDDGTLMHASVRVGDSTIMVADGTEQWPSFPVWLHVYVDDVDAAYQRALDHGGIPVQEPANQQDGDRRAGVRDVAGNTWWIGGSAL
ncbi:VOC family protein [Flaviflagellibacter deserti]|uniref:VOC family protein n=1 Tax=Flaviflagellibacter deserti TaxID=2267266 RepID=UPI0036D29DF6